MPTRLRHVGRLVDTLYDLEPKLVNKVLRKALRAGAKVQQKAVKARAPRATGALRKSVKVRSAKRRKNRVAILVSTTGGHPTPMVAATEYGTANQKPQPFIRPGFSASVGETTAAVVATMKAEIRNLKAKR